MKVYTRHIVQFICFFSFLTLFSGCDMKKNNWFNRNYQALNTKYNVYFNANESFKKGYKKIEESFSPDYSHVIPVYAVSDKSTEGVAKNDMSRTVEKCETAIQERSMLKKPKKDFSKMKDPKYVMFYNQEEFNSYMDEVWMLLGEAKFYSNDYLAASATFSYVIKHFSLDETLVTKANIWKARALKEMEWYYEAEDLLKRIDAEELPIELQGLYYGAYADLKVSQHDYEEALPFLLKAVELEEERTQRIRFSYILAQIYQLKGDKKSAYDWYEKVIRANPSYQMAFNAQVHQTEVFSGKSSEELISRLKKMAKNRNNEDYLDQIYYAIGNIYWAQSDSAKAIENYLLSVEKSTRHGKEKAQTLIVLGDIYYDRLDYVSAQPCYSEASSIIDHKHEDYLRVSRLANILDKLVVDYTTYTLQDSLLALSVASKSELSAAIGRAIKVVQEEERKEAERLAKEREEQRQLELEIENMAVMDSRALGTTNEATWYFYNKSTVEKGKLEFRRKFGQRRLEDNWNRRNKTIMVFSEETLADRVDSELFDMTEEGAGGETADPNQLQPEYNPKRPEYYLKQIPFSEEQKVASHQQLSDALFNMATLYEDDLKDYEKAVEAYNEFVRRYPNDPRSADAYYNCYRIYGKLNNQSEVEAYRAKLIEQYPQSTYAMILSQPDYRRQMERMTMEQDSLYELTYAAFLNSSFDTVRAMTKYMEETYPVSNLMPKFLLLNSLAIGKTQGKDTFSASLNKLLERYPESDVAFMAKDILALISQGLNPEEGSSSGGLMALRQENLQEEMVEAGVTLAKNFTVNYDSPYLFKLITDTNKVDVNKLLYETAVYNFTKFLVKDFDLEVRMNVLTVSGLDNYEEALWYIRGFIEDKGIQELLKGTDYKYLLISPENLDLIGRGFTLEDYDKFYKDSIVANYSKDRAVRVELVEEKVDTVQAKVDELKEGDDLTKAKFTTTNSSASNVSKEKVSSPSKDHVQQGAIAGEENGDVSKENTAAPAENILKQESEVSPVQMQKVAEEKVLQEENKEEKSVVEEKKEEPIPSAPKKELKKYKGLYTYDPEASHYLVNIVTNGGADEAKVVQALNTYNQKAHALLNLKVQTSSTNAFKQLFIVGEMPSADVALSYMRQEVKSLDVKQSFGSNPYRTIVISKDNLEVLKSSGNIAVYMELYKRLYLKR